jgi:hypothetical protein
MLCGSQSFQISSKADGTFARFGGLIGAFPGKIWRHAKSNVTMRIAARLGLYYPFVLHIIISYKKLS